MTLRFHPEHTWARDDGQGIVTVGITQHAQDTLGDIVFTDLPTIGKSVSAGAVSCVVESVKTAADVFAPVSGTVMEVNEALRSDPSLANSAPESDGWFYKLRMDDPAELLALMDEAVYRPFAASA
ncbi:MAG: Glycine cleavage system protein [Pseudomonadota bacterium]|jgi:glycine cleavage system H protein